MKEVWWIEIMATNKTRKGVKTKHHKYNSDKRDVTFYLTKEAINLLGQKAQSLGISRSELLEMYSRGEIPAEEAQFLGEPLAS
jgi:phosphoenolpyruvate-protein kinase (PTS system EI component)